MRRIGRLVSVVVVAILLGACGDGAASPSSAATTSPPASTPSPAPSVAVAETMVLKGSGPKTGQATTLSGDYKAKVILKTKPGCKWSVSLDGLPAPTLAKYTSDAGGTFRTSVDLVGLDPNDYKLVVKSKKCGTWSVSLARP